MNILLIILNGLEKISPIFYEILYMSIKASVIGIIGFIILKILKKKIRPKHMYMIGLIFVMLLVIPIKINSKYNIDKYLPWNLKNDLASSYISTENNKNYFIKSNENDLFQNNYNVQEIESLFNLKIIIKLLIPIIWLMVIIVKSLIIFWAKQKFSKELKDFKCEDKRILNILEKCKKDLNVNININVFIGEKFNVPSILGIKDVKILLPETAYNLTDKELEYVIIHELFHYKRKDNFMILFILILQTIYFFNPIILLCLEIVKNNMEYAVDEKVMMFFNNEEHEYCCTLIKLSCKKEDYTLEALVNNFSSNKDILTQRIRRVKNKRENYKFAYVIFTIIIFGVGLFSIYTVSKNLGINYISDLVFNNFSNKRYVKVECFYSDEYKKYNTSDSEQGKNLYDSTEFLRKNMQSILSKVNNRNLFYKHLGNEIYNSKECAIISIYSKTKNNFASVDYWIDINSGDIMKEETYYNLENSLKPDIPITKTEYSYLDKLPK
ncbi:MAG: M56 family metallopeptidase [Clostridia bacterium]|nr:M56 family metallopeptidase [Clostridia bacterium]